MKITPQEALKRTIEHREIFYDEMLDLMRMMMRGEVSPVMMSAIITGLRVKKETVGEITAAAQVLAENVVPLPVRHRDNLVDTVGTGGDGAHTFNISTCAAFVAAACGAHISKHGGRSVSSSSGAADVLEAMGADLERTPEQIAQSIDQIGMGFMFAQLHHPVMKNVAAIREEMAVKTLFNILGPLTNPAGAKNILLGVFHEDLVGILVRVLERLGFKHALVIFGRDVLDEISIGAATLVGELRDGRVREYDIHPEDFGIPMAGVRNIRAENASDSLRIIMEVLSGSTGPARNVVLLNAGATLYAGNLVGSIAEGIERARTAIDSGAAKAKMEAFIAFNRKR